MFCLLFLINLIKTKKPFKHTLLEGLYPAIGPNKLPYCLLPQDTAMHRQVFWLYGSSSFLLLPTLLKQCSGLLQISSPITAAGPLPIFTGFPFKLKLSTYDIDFIINYCLLQVNTYLDTPNGKFLHLKSLQNTPLAQ
jgi:hypothetical protein